MKQPIPSTLSTVAKSLARGFSNSLGNWLDMDGRDGAEGRRAAGKTLLFADLFAGPERDGS